jgi:dipeptidyl aminopeptidase/acylaminoacyl peptidase
VTQDTNIWRANISAVDRIPSVPELFISSTRRDEKPRYSPDGEKIAFVSMRSGSPEIWVSKADGSSPVRISDLGGPLVGYPNWSPDGHSLVFHARPEGQADLFVMPAAGGSPKRLTTHAADDTMPSYSRDGRGIYFGSARTGRQEIWRMPSEGGDAVQLSNSGGMRPVEDPDGKSLYYLTLDGGEIQRISPAGGPVVKVVAGIHGYPAGFATAREGIYYQAPPLSGRQRFIRFFSFSTRESRPVAVASHPFFFGLSVSPDSKYVLFDQFDVSGTDLMLVKNFYAR